MNPFEVNMSEALRKLAEDIIPSAELLTAANVAADNVSHSLIFLAFLASKYTVNSIN